MFPVFPGGSVSSVSATVRGGAATIVEPAYVSVTADESSTASSAKFNVFSDASYPGTFDHTVHVEKDITFKPGEGKFCITRTGKYVMNLGLLIMSSSSVQLIEVRIEKNTVEIWSSDPLVHSSVNPTYLGMAGLIFDLAVNDEIKVFVDSTVADIEVNAGSTFGMHIIE